MLSCRDRRAPVRARVVVDPRDRWKACPRVLSAGLEGGDGRREDVRDAPKMMDEKCQMGGGTLREGEVGQRSLLAGKGTDRETA